MGLGGYGSKARPTGAPELARGTLRFDTAVARHAEIAAARGDTLVVGTHGLAPTLCLASRIALDPGPAHFWADLRFRDVIEVDLADGMVSRRFG
ncbi:hypothetical protein Pen02_76010 [Plantactinospora endophytica]|uniref:Histidine phosphatase family protein n=1 Tax=Plantactinospora endophytica TaxID=673535 RepID=A0ABQ4ED62_9ACTN|nr:hypothetical protein Pen02_76010 [Plantactinospora endophytica]